MRILTIVAVVTTVCLSPASETQTIAAAPSSAFLIWTVSPGTFANGVWTIPGTTTLTAAAVDESGNPIVQGQLVWQTCGGTGQDLATHHSATDCQQSGPVRWQDAVILDPANPTPISPCFCAGVQQGFRLTYRSQGGSGFRSATGTPFDLFAQTSCPITCP